MAITDNKLRKIILLVLAAILVPIILFVIIVLSISGPGGFRSFYRGLTGKTTGDLERIVIARDQVSSLLSMGTPVPEYQYASNTWHAPNFYNVRHLDRIGASAAYYYALPQSVVTKASAEKLKQSGWDVFEGNLTDEEKSLSGTKGCLQITISEPKPDKFVTDEEAAIKQYGANSVVTKMILSAYKICEE